MPAGGCLQNSSPDGVHYLIEFFGCDKKQLDSIVFWKRLLLGATAGLDVRVLNRHFHRFNPHGITGYLLLSASHISIHTWPEHAYAACDVFTCSGKDEATDIVQYLEACIHHETIRKRKVRRGFRVG